jgi:hypothetical protein
MSLQDINVGEEGMQKRMHWYIVSRKHNVM